jgi:eukaryotic-like serine/threonine-protein kinase
MTAGVSDLQRVLGELYRIERELGAGGMATVYLAHDPKHDRRVAIKVLRPELAAIVGGERFLKEIRTTANLQHPHILPLHDSGNADGTVYYVMPYVEGESLRQRLTREKQLPVDEAIRIAREVAAGLDYAHRHGVVHRDIKPENILLHDGQALVADFGIALAVSRSDGGTRMTETGMSLGTPNYMSPEQAMGEREITPKSDVYALGAVLYEMLVGEPPFTGPTPQAVFARVLTDEPRSLTLQRKTIPPHVDAAVAKALSKLPADRFASAAEFSEALVRPTSASGVATGAHHTPRAGRRAVAIAGAAALAGLALGALSMKLVQPTARVAPAARFGVKIPFEARLIGAPVAVVTLSPDGSTIVYSGEGPRGQQLFKRNIDDLAVTPIPGTEGGFSPAFTSDGAWILYASGAGVRKIPVAGGSPQPVTLPNAAGFLFAGSPVTLDADGALASGDSGVLVRVKPDGRVERLAVPAPGEVALFPAHVMPDGRILMVSVADGTAGALVILDPKNGERKTVVRSQVGGAAYHDGYIAWVLQTGALVGARWDDARGELGPSTVLAPDVRILAGAAPQIAFSSNGSLVYVPAQPSDLVRVDRNGRVEPIGAPQKRYHNPRLSPDGSRIATDISEERRDVWLLSLRDPTLTRISFDNDGHDPLWMPDGKSVIYSTARAGTIGAHRRRVDGSGGSDSLLHDGVQLSAHSITPDGKFAYAASLALRGGYDIVRFNTSGGKAEPVLATPFFEQYPAVSPNGKWLAYVSDESGRAEVYVRPLETAAGRVQVSVDGGVEPVWSRDGRDLFYRHASEPNLLVAAIATSPELRVASRQMLFKVDDYESASPHANYDVTPDGKFIFVRTARAAELIYIQNWTELVRRGSVAR